MNLTSLDSERTQILEPIQEDIPPVLSEWTRSRQFYKLLKKIGEPKFEEEKNLFSNMNDRLWSIAMGICRCNEAYCPLRAIIQFLSVETEASIRLSVVIIGENKKREVVQVTLNRAHGERDLMISGEVVLYWAQLRMILENQADCILAARAA